MKPIHIIQFVVRAVDYDSDKWYDICMERLSEEKAVIFHYYIELFRDISSDCGTHKNLFLGEYTTADNKRLTTDDIRAIRNFCISDYIESVVLYEENVPRIITERYMIIEM